MQVGLHELAIKRLTEVLKTNPTSIRVLLARAEVEENAGLFYEAKRDYEQLIKLSPPCPLNWSVRIALAKILAEAPDEELRDGKLAVQLAEEAISLSDWPPLEAYDVLSAAYAENGDFKRASRTLRLALKNFPQQLDCQFQEHLARYESGKALRDRHESSRVQVPSIARQNISPCSSFIAAEALTTSAISGSSSGKPRRCIRTRSR